MDLKNIFDSRKYHYVRIKNTDCVIMMTDHNKMVFYSKKVYANGSPLYDSKMRNYLEKQGYKYKWSLNDESDWGYVVDRIKYTERETGFFTKEEYEKTKKLLSKYTGFKQTTPEYGVELEIESDKNMPSEIRNLIYETNKTLIDNVGSDSSVRGGTEIRFKHPQMKGWKYKDIAKILKVCRDNGATNKYGTAGMHIHISRPDIRVVVNRFIENLDTMQHILYPINCRELTKATGAKMNYGVGSNIYRDQVSSFGTLEIRAWNSTLDPHLFLARIKFCKYFTQWLAKTKEVSIESFFNSLTKKQKENYNYMLNHAENPHKWGFPAKAVNTLLA